MDPYTNPNLHYEVLAKRAAEGDDRSFQELYNAISGKMYSLCLRYSGNSNDANDWFQEGFEKLFYNLASFRGQGSFEGWARRIFLNTCIDQINKRNLVSPIQTEEIEVEADELNGFDRLAADDLIRLVRDLPDGYRTVFNLYLIEGYSHREIGELLQISEEGSRSQLYRARVLLQKMLKGTHG